jgi:hypothetical protein
MAAYGGSYYRISRRSLAELRPYDAEGFLYVPCDEVLRTQNLDAHVRWMQFYGPANWVDRTFFAGPSPMTCVLFSMSK